jgi:hypothetical protein
MPACWVAVVGGNKCWLSLLLPIVLLSHLAVCGGRPALFVRVVL